MRFKNSVRLIFENFSSIYKVLLYRVIVLAILASLISALIMPNIMRIINSAQLRDIFSLLKEFIKSLLKGDLSIDYDEKFKDATINFYDFIKLNSGRFIVSGFLLAVIVFIGRYLNGFSNFALGIKINDHMTSLSDFPFVQCLVRDIKNAALYQLVHTSVSFFFDIFAFLLCYNILFGLYFMFGLFSVVLASAVFIALIALKLALLSNFMPAVIADKKKIRTAFALSLRPGKKQFLRTYSTYFVSAFLILYINATMAIFTFFSGLIVTLPLSYLLLICIQFVGYYAHTGKKYFINYDNIIVPKTITKEVITEDIDL